jgi:hypothetical protein
MKNRIVLIVILFTVFCVSGCKKFLDRKPLTATLDDLHQGGLETQALGLYGTIRNSSSSPYVGDGFESIPWIGMNGFRSDDQEIVSDPGAAQWHTIYDLFGGGQYAKDDWASGVYWDRHYILIGNCNTALQIADSLQLTDDASLTNIGEIKFFRALSYWDLVRNYGQIPKVDFRIYNPTDAQIPKSPEDTIYALIESDLQFAADHLPLTWGPQYNGRLTSGAAKTLLAKEQIWRKQWATALSLCNDVINSGVYKLHVPYWDIWKLDQELGEESIFEVQASEKPGDGGFYWSWFGTTQGVRGADADGWNLGWGWNTPTKNLVDAYEPNDPREGATILFSGHPDSYPGPGNTITAANGGYGKDLPPYTNALYWNKKVYVSQADRDAAGDPNGGAFINHRVLRYADVILMAAECANETGDGATAAARLEEIRARARNGDNTILPYIAFQNQVQMRAAIKHERRIEFGMEFERFYDLVRWGDATSVLGGLGYQQKNRYFPLPTTAISANPKLVQNPDYN